MCVDTFKFLKNDLKKCVCTREVVGVQKSPKITCDKLQLYLKKYKLE